MRILFRVIAGTLGAALVVLHSAGASAELSGEGREQFVKGAIESCSQRAHMSSPGLPLSTVSAFCSCMANKEADLTTTDDIAYMNEHKAAPEEWRQKVLALTPICSAEVGITPKPPRPAAQPPGQSPTAAAPPKDEIPLVQEGDAYLVPVAINGADPVGFVAKAAAGGVALPPETVFDMKKAGTLKTADFVGSKVYHLSDGRVLPSDKFKIRKLTIGKHVLHDVKGFLNTDGTDLVLGGNVLVADRFVVARRRAPYAGFLAIGARSPPPSRGHA